MRQFLKILRPLLLLVVIAVVMGWLVGGRTHTWTTQLETQAEPDRIFQEITQPERMKRWMSEVVEVERMNDLPPNVGTRDRIVTEDKQGTQAVVESVIVELDSERMLKLHLETPRYDATSTFIIEPKGDAYRVQQRLQAQYKGLYRFVTPFIESAEQNRLDADFQSLKRRLNEPGEVETSIAN